MSEDMNLTSHVDFEKNNSDKKNDELWKGARGDERPHWYVIHTYSGHEQKVKANIEKMAENREMQELILSVVVPTEETAEPKDGKMVIKSRKVFPGYVIVKMIVTNASWYLVRNTQGVTGFVGHGSDPLPLSDEEVRRMGIENIDVDFDLKEGDRIRVIRGSLENHVGIVERVNTEKKVVKARFPMGRGATLVELEFAKIDKIVNN